ncbi:hypothetical protein C5167_026819 [Papaver somniferum]|nr:hypothetical protein C5167_026819 [Papaver somniferum]
MVKTHMGRKLENVLLDANGDLKFSDFGLSALPQQLREDGLLHTMCGTPNYVAPEVLNGTGYDGAKADFWSCGVILFVLMAGYLPSDDSNLMELYKKISKAEFLIPSYFSSGSRKVIKRILDPDPSKKPPGFEQEETNLDDVDAIFNNSEESRNLVVEKKDEKPVTMNAFELISHSQDLKLSNLFDKQMVFEVATSLNMVELPKAGGDTLEFHNFYKNISTGLDDVIVWKSEEEAKKPDTDVAGPS